ncbi:MAG: hypothetical protein JF589_01595 [Gemmatimonadetes bacterium]|nr:hypothetical protein [Gemmatimonadota bacterium]
MKKLLHGAAALSTCFALAACANSRGLGSVLGSALVATQVSGLVQGVDTQSQRISLQSSNGQSMDIRFDGDTKVVFNNQSYPVTSLDRGDQVTVRVQSTRSGYYTDLVQVDQPVRGSSGSASSSNVQTIRGTVHDVDTQNGLFSLDVEAGARVMVSMPYSPNRADMKRFQNLRQGDSVRIAGVYLNSSRVELRQFY